MVEIVVQYLIPALSLLLMSRDRKRGVLWLFIGVYYGLLGLVLHEADQSSLAYLSLLMLSPLVNSLALVGLVSAVESNLMKPAVR